MTMKLPLARRALIRPELQVVDHGWGYVVRSPHPMKTLPPGWEIGAWSASISLMALVWFLLGEQVIWGIAPSLLLLAATHFALRWFTSVQAFEMAVDGRRREIRMGRLMPHGQVWFALGAGFDEVRDIVLHKDAAGAHSLWVWIHGEEEPVAFARGEEAALLAIHDRLIGDLRSRAARAPVPVDAEAEEAVPGRRPFPPLVPRELT